MKKNVKVMRAKYIEIIYNDLIQEDHYKNLIDFISSKCLSADYTDNEIMSQVHEKLHRSSEYTQKSGWLTEKGIEIVDAARDFLVEFTRASY